MRDRDNENTRENKISLSLFLYLSLSHFLKLKIYGAFIFGAAPPLLTPNFSLLTKIPCNLFPFMR